MPVDTSRCANCGIELEAVVGQQGGQSARPGGDQARYCCDGCADGGPCTC